MNRVGGITLAAALIAGVFGCEEPRATPSTEANWTVRGGNAGRTRRGPDMDLAVEPVRAWERQMAAELGGETTTRAVADGERLFVYNLTMGTCDPPQPGAVSLTALALAEGKVLWRREDLGCRDVALAGDRLVVATLDAVIALDAGSGKELWRRPLPMPEYFPESILSDGERVYVVCDKQVLLALDVRDARVVWSAKLFEGDDTRYTPGADITSALAGGTVLVAGRSDFLHGYDAASGREVWRKRLPRLLSRSVQSGGMAAGPGGLWLQWAQGHWSFSAHDYLVGLDGKDQRPLWIKSSPGRVSHATGQSMATDGVRVVYRCWARQDLECLDIRSGALLWRVRPGGEGEFSDPVISGGSVLLVTDEGVLTSFDIRSGKPQWKIPLGAPIHHPTDNVLVSGRYVIVYGDHGVWVYRPSGS